MDWTKKPCFVVASGPSLTKETAWLVRKSRWLNESNVIVVNDAYKLLLCADVLYAADYAWWKKHNGAKEFRGERWTSHSKSTNFVDDKSEVASQFNLNLVNARDADGFSTDGKSINYGNPLYAHSGFQAVNLAVMFGAKRICLVGFDYGFKGSSAHFFGNHQGLRNSSNADYERMAKAYDKVVTDAEIVNATPGSNLKRFPFVDLAEEVQRHRGSNWDWTESLKKTG